MCDLAPRRRRPAAKARQLRSRTRSARGRDVMSRLTLFIVILGCLGLSFCAQQHSRFPLGLYAGVLRRERNRGRSRGWRRTPAGTSSRFPGGEAGPQYHFPRHPSLLRSHRRQAPGVRRSGRIQFRFPDAVTIDDSHYSPSTTPNKSYLIGPYAYGMAVEYCPVVPQNYYRGFLATQRAQDVYGGAYYLDPTWCNASAHLWVGDVGRVTVGCMRSVRHTGGRSDFD